MIITNFYSQDESRGQSCDQVVNHLALIKHRFWSTWGAKFAEICLNWADLAQNFKIIGGSRVIIESLRVSTAGNQSVFWKFKTEITKMNVKGGATGQNFDFQSISPAGWIMRGHLNFLVKFLGVVNYERLYKFSPF